MDFMKIILDIPHKDMSIIDQILNRLKVNLFKYKFKLIYSNLRFLNLIILLIFVILMLLIKIHSIMQSNLKNNFKLTNKIFK